MAFVNVCVSSLWVSLELCFHDERLLNTTITAITMTSANTTNTNTPTMAPITAPEELLLSSAERVALIVKPSLSVVGGVPEMVVTGVSGVEVVAGVPGVEVVAEVPGVWVVAGVPGVEVVAGVPGVEVVAGVPEVEVVAGVPEVGGASVGTEGAIKITLWAWLIHIAID